MTARALAFALVAAGLLLAAGEADGGVRTATIPAPPVPEACGGGRSESTPQVAVRPGRRRHLTAIVLVDGGSVTTGAASRDGGRSWSPSAVTGSTACVDGPPERQWTVNPRVALGSDGTAWHGASWMGRSNGLRDLGVEASSSPDGGTTWLRGAEPAGEGQDAVVVPDPVEPGRGLLVWIHHDQVPNPFRVASAGMDLRRATVHAGVPGEIDGPVAYEPSPGRLLDDPKVVRLADGSLLALVSEVSLGDFAGALNPLTAGDPVRFHGLALRSEDEGDTWSEPVSAGAPVLFRHTHAESGTTFPFGLSDAAAGRGERAAIVWAEPADGERPGRLMIQRTRDGGRTWKPPREVAAPAQLLFSPAVAIAPDGTTAFFWYDNRNDQPGDDRLDVDAWGLIKRRGAEPQEVHLAGPFDLVPLRDPQEYDVDGNALGVVQDVVALPRRRFGFAYAVPATDDGVTDVRFSVVRRARTPRRG